MKNTYKLTKDIIYNEVLIIKEKPEVVGELLKKYDINSIIKENNYLENYTLLSIKKHIAIGMTFSLIGFAQLDKSNMAFYETTLEELEQVLGE